MHALYRTPEHAQHAQHNRVQLVGFVAWMILQRLASSLTISYPSMIGGLHKFAKCRQDLR